MSKDTRAGKAGDASSEVLIEQVEDSHAHSLWNEAFQSRVLEVAMRRSRPDFEETTWKAVECSWVHGKAAMEVAEELQVPVPSVYVARSRVLKRLGAEVVTLAEDYLLRLSRC